MSRFSAWRCRRRRGRQLAGTDPLGADSDDDGLFDAAEMDLDCSDPDERAALIAWGALIRRRQR